MQMQPMILLRPQMETQVVPSAATVVLIIRLSGDGAKLVHNSVTPAVSTRDFAVGTDRFPSSVIELSRVQNTHLELSSQMYQR